MSNRSINQDKYDEIYKVFQNVNDREINGIGKVLGKGAFGQVRDIKFKGKIVAGKVIENSNQKGSNSENLALELRGQNIVKIIKVYTKKISDKDYILILMEKAVLRDLGKLNEFYHRHNLLKLIDENLFDEKSGDNLLRFYTRQIINGLELLDRSNFIHFDIKPENLLITVNLIIKLSDFSLLTKIEEKEAMSLPGGTQGFLTPEYFRENDVSNETAKRQDYFALGCTLFLLKFGIHMFKYKKYDSKNMNADRILDLIIKNEAFIKSNIFMNKSFMYFLIKLIQYKPHDRLSFEEIYRNKWLNKNINELEDTINAFDHEEEKLIMELQKKDFLIKKEKVIKKDKNNFIKFNFKKKSKNK